MQKDPNLLQEKMEVIENSTWYRQRFDACPHFMFFLGDAHISNVQHTKYPFGQTITYAGFSKNRADWYHSLPDLEQTAGKIIEASTNRPNISKEMIADFHKWEDSFYETCLKIKNTNLSALENDALIALYKELAEIYTNKLNSSPLIDGFALSTDTLIANKIKIYLEEIGEGNKFVEYFSILTAPIFLSFLQQEEIALLEIAKQINQDQSLEENLLEAHQQNYFWISNNYVKDYVVPISTFTERLGEYKKIDIDSKIEEIKSLPISHKKEKEELIHAINLPQDIQTLLNITDDFNQWQDERKKGTFWATHYFSLFLEEVAQRTKYSIDQLKYTFPPEIDQITTEQISPQELDQRIEYCMILWVLDRYAVITDIDTITKLDRIGTGDIAHSIELSGFTASRGIATGTVKIIESVEEIQKIEEGDILVAVMTRPDYLPAMKKAAAFVTDEGGITCHAAIVAREMKKPCIIGTKIATKTLADGDKVEVDADTGVVRIVNNE